jgi:uncharacterized protein (TIGR03790 family)
MPLRTAISCGICTLAVFLAASDASAQDASNVLLVVNEKSAQSQAIGARYLEARSVPPDNVVRITTEPAEQIERQVYEREIERPIAEWLISRKAQDRILYIVLTKDVPFQVRGTLGRGGTHASVDSELTLLYRRLTGAVSSFSGSIANPYFAGARPVNEFQPFSHEHHDIYLVCRLDGFSVEDVFRLIDRGAAPSSHGSFLLDQKGTPADAVGDGWLQASADALKANGLGERVVFDGSPSGLTGVKDVLGYYSWGSNDPALHRRRLELEFAPGAIAATFTSRDARTLKPPPENWIPGPKGAPFEGSTQSLAGDLIRDGATGVAGHVSEPYLDGAVRPDILFPAYARGLNLAEAFYLATPHISWQTMIIGDPLCRPFSRAALAPLPASEIDTETELPKYFSERQVAVVMRRGISEAAAKLLVKADVHQREGDLTAAREALEKATALEPGLMGAQLLLADLYERAQAYDLAVARYRTVLESSPNDVMALNNLAYALSVRQNNPAEALPLAQKAYESLKGTKNAAIADTLGWIYHLLGRDDEAERLIVEAAQAAPRNAEITLHLAQILLMRGRLGDAKSALARVLELDPALDDRDDVKVLKQKLAASLPQP